MNLQKKARVFSYCLTKLSAREGIAGRGAAISRGARHISLSVRLANPLQMDRAIALADPLALQTGTQVVIAKRIDGLIVYQFELRNGLWEEYTRADVTGLGVGLGDSRRQINFEFSESAPHSLIAGTTGSGKTETVRSILAGLCTEYTPDDMSLIVIDRYRNYKEFGNVAHLICPIAHGDQEIDNTVAIIRGEFARRKDNDIKDGKRCVIVCDEAEEVLHDGRLDTFVAIGVGGRQFKMNLIVSSQKPLERTLPNLTDKCLNRWVGLVDNARTSHYLTGHSELNCHKLTGQGDFVHVVGPHNDRLLVARATQADFEKLPRADIPEPESPPEDTIRILDEPAEESRGGRPPNEVEPEMLACYLLYPNLTIKQANEYLGIKYHTHRKYKQFAERLVKQVKILRGKK